jgi:hypothetical protein
MISEETRPIIGTGAIWIGLLDLDRCDEIVGISGTMPTDHRLARIVIRQHRTPVGNVLVPTSPAETLTARVRAAADENLADALRDHADWDLAWKENGADRPWEVRVGCAIRFPAEATAGLSVVICTRDRTEALTNCLEALSQISNNALEIIVVDNAPTSGATRQVVLDRAQNDPRIVYTCEPSPGLSRARNHGLNEAR